MRVFAAIDIGASGGRVIAGLVEPESVTLQTIHRFENYMHDADGHLRWDIRRLYDEVLAGLADLARQYPQVESIGIDTWAVDYALLDTRGALLADPIAYRDDRTTAVIDDVHRIVGAAELYEINGLQHLPFTTLFQLATEQQNPSWERAAHAVLIPDLLAYWLTGELRTEYTNASTTGLVDVHDRAWSTELTRRLRIPDTMLPPLDQPGDVRGRLLPAVAAKLGLSEAVVLTTVGSHDTASAVVGVPATHADFAYIASGTWSLVGLELSAPIVTDASRLANFTNEGGVDGRTRFLRNVGGLWLLQESMRTWAAGGDEQELADLLAAAGPLAPTAPTIDIDDPAFIPPGDMPARIVAAATAHGVTMPSSPAAITACIVESLAVGYARTIDRARTISGRSVDVVHIVGGGSQNNVLCRRTAVHCGVPVIAGPIEATALGNVCVQAMSRGALPGDLDVVRGTLAANLSLVTYEPHPSDR